MEIQALGYVGVHAMSLEDWSTFGTKFLGMQLVDKGGKNLAFRMDDRKQRVVVSEDGAEGVAFFGWEVADAAALNRIATRLEQTGVTVSRGSRTLADERRVRELIVLADPLGNRIEIFHGAEIAQDAFKPGRSISGFRTGPLGMGHAVLHVEDVEPLLPFYRDLLGFRISDYGLTPYKLYFFHINGRHHSFAMVGSGKRGLHHFMIELLSIDDVGQGYDLAQLEEGRVAYTLGRHTNDHMVSFYSHSPSGFFVEYGWSGRVIDPATWQPHETFDGPSFWGHERLYMMPPEQRARLREMRLSAAAKGLRAPVSVVDCPWLYAVIAGE